MLRSVFALAGAVALAFSTSAGAQALTDDFGKLVGWNGVTVNGIDYNVRFVDGTCASVFGGCDSNSDFAFTTEADASLAAQALLDQVFVSYYDDNAALTFGCSDSNGCVALTPFWSQNGSVRFSEAINYSLGQGTDFSRGSVVTWTNSITTTGNSQLVWAVFSPQFAPAAVPEPGTWAMMLLGFGAMGFAMRRDRRNQLVRAVG